MKTPAQQVIDKAKVYALVANILWGTSFLATKIMLEVWGPFAATLLRFSLALVTMLALGRGLGFPIKTPQSKSHWIGVVLVGVTGFGLLYPLQLQGLLLINTGISATVMLLAPLFLVVFGLVLLRESFSGLKLFAILLGICGGLFLYKSQINLSNSTNYLWGITLTLFASISLALSALFTRKFLANMSAQDITFWSMLIGTVALLPFVLTESKSIEFSFQNNYKALISLIYLSTVCSVICFFLWNKAISLAPASELASAMHIKTPVTFLLGVLVLNEPLTIQLLFGVFVISIAVTIAQKPTTKRLA